MKRNPPANTRLAAPDAAMLSRRHLVAGAALLPLIAACGPAEAPVWPRASLLIGDALSPAQRAAADRLFADADGVGETRALLLLADGVPVLEGYGEGFGPANRLISWSMAKTITAVLIGILVGDGRLALDDPAPIPDWQRSGDPRGAITLRHLLHMASGLDHVEDGDPVWESDTVAMLFGAGAGDMAAIAEAKPAAAAPGELFNYSSATSVILSDIIARALTDSRVASVRRDAVRNLIAGRLAGPLGMNSLVAEFDAAGTMVGGSIMHATARDYARFGELLRRRGETADGRRIVADSWVDFLRTPSPANPGYGGHLWLNRPQPDGGSPLWPGQGPDDVFACLGHQGQFIIVSPSRRMTLVRLGISTRPQIAAARDSLRAIMAG